MKICNKQGCGVCVNCDCNPPLTNGISHGDICRKTVENIMHHLEDGQAYRFVDGKLYLLNFYQNELIDEEECDIVS